MSWLRSLGLAVVALLSVSMGSSVAQTVDITVFAGRDYPVYDERLRFRTSLPVLPRVAISESRPLEITTEGGAAFGAAVAVEVGIMALEARIDATNVGFAINGTRYELIATAPVTTPIASITIGEGRLEADRFNLLSLNARLRTPGRVGLVASGGLSYLPGVTINGAVPVIVDAPGLGSFATPGRLSLTAAPGQDEHRWGVNGGAGVRIGGGPLAVVVEARAFYFREFELRLAASDGPDLLGAVAAGIPPIRFEPVVLNANAGVVWRF